MITGRLPASGPSDTTWRMVWQRTKHAGVSVRHMRACPTAGNSRARCKCRRSYRASRRHPLTGKVVSSPSFADINEALSWYLAAGQKAAPVLRERAEVGRTFQSLADEWGEGVEQGRIGKRRGQRGYSQTTLQGYERSLRHVLIPEFGPRPAGEISAQDWQLFVDRLARDGLSRSRIANHLARGPRDLRLGLPADAPSGCRQSHDRHRAAARRRGQA